MEHCAFNIVCQYGNHLHSLVIKLMSSVFCFDLKVDVQESPAIANTENVRVVPTIKIYKNGCRVKEMICPSPEVLESSVRHYSF